VSAGAGASPVVPAAAVPASRAAPAGAITVDVEEYFQVENLRAAAAPASWEGFESRVEPSTRLLLDLFDERGVKATFFTLGWVAERHKGLVAEIARRGHEVASHGHGHEMLTTLDPERFRADLRRARAALEDAAQERVLGYRAPTWSIVPATEWALDVLVEEGYLYDSSVFPVRHDRYGDPAAPIVPHLRRRAAGAIVELPPLVLRALGTNWPAAGGGYLRLLPLWYTRAAIRQAAREGRPAVLYLHPWEVDPGQPRLKVGWLKGLRHYAGLAGMKARLAAALREGSFGRAVDLAARCEAGAYSMDPG
jgi:polysaccharide deacetylase family protein (PEP-CTERM system associated)